MNPRPQTPVPAPASYTPTPADLDELHVIRSIHDVLDVALDLPLDLRLGLLDYVAARLAGGSTTSRREAARG